LAKIVAPTGDGNGNSNVSKRAILSEKNGENSQNQPINRDAILVQRMSPWNECRQTQSMTDRKI